MHTLWNIPLSVSQRSPQSHNDEEAEAKISLCTHIWLDHQRSVIGLGWGSTVKARGDLRVGLHCKARGDHRVWGSTVKQAVTIGCGAPLAVKLKARGDHRVWGSTVKQGVTIGWGLHCKARGDHRMGPHCKARGDHRVWGSTVKQVLS